MNNRIKQLFEHKKKNIVSIYITAGFPSLSDTLKIIKELDSVGVDMIEIGFPFSDPMADGPVIQQSSETAIENGMTLKVLFEQLKELRTVTQLPVLLMGYLNPVLQFGEVDFINKCHDTGIDGIIIPDMPLSYYQDNLQEFCNEKGISNTLLITPQTAVSRIHEIDNNSDGFIYMVSSNSITGGTNDNNLNTDYLERTQKLQLKNPQLTGFGIHDSASFNNASRYSSGCIIGSAFISHITKNGIEANSIKQFINNLHS
ncbi:tryptophan synthase subunit alpha [Flavobacterium cerinum]|uniref:Tryptophan synthase alpha chain n=1 Tax=Flavobacterium cerinum TaxID=2502784 RepID=A0A3S3TSM8_9FLAO|nr:tryptophan synthase subunit alpha [Flavobacterium cerinum]RWW91892.1 tryptophan synthase subunit alpha [Flavobacterium cerinum]